MGVVDDLDDGGGGVEVEPEALLHHRPGHQLAHQAGFEAGVGEVEHGGGEADQRVDRRRRAVGDAEPQVGQAVVVVAVGGEGGLEQRGEGGEVGGHDDDVARFERRVGGEDVEDGVAGDLDLAAGAVGDVDLDRAVRAGDRRRAARSVARRSARLGAMPRCCASVEGQQSICGWTGGPSRLGGAEPAARRTSGRGPLRRLVARMSCWSWARVVGSGSEA